jgi:protein SHQ1
MFSDKAIRSLAHKLHHIKIPKEKVGWELETLEHLALETSHEHSI